MKYYQPLGEQADAPYIDANSAGGIEGSAVPAGAIEHPQREIVNAIKAAGLEPDAEDMTQLGQAIEIMLSKVVSLPPQVGNSGKILTTDGTNASWDNAKNGVALGTILSSGFDAALATPAGSLWCDGAEWTGYNADGSKGMFADFYDKLVAGKIKSVPMADFDTAILDAGWCGVCGLDVANKIFRAPKITNSAQINIVPTAKNKNLGRTLIESYVENGIDVQLFSDRWCIQKGFSTQPTQLINLALSYTDTSYALRRDPTILGTQGVAAYSFAPAEKTKSSFKIFTNQYQTEVDWQAFGYVDVAPTTQLTPNYYIVVYNGAVEASMAQASEFITGLNGKLNSDFSNVTTIGKSFISAQGKPSNRFTDLVLGVHGTIYEAPENGRFAISKIAGADFYYCNIIALIKGANGDLCGTFSDAWRTSACECKISVQKGQSVRVDYNATGALNYFRFIYDEGVK